MLETKYRLRFRSGENGYCINTEGERTGQSLPPEIMFDAATESLGSVWLLQSPADGTKLYRRCVAVQLVWWVSFILLGIVAARLSSMYGAYMAIPYCVYAFLLGEVILRVPDGMLRDKDGNQLHVRSGIVEVPSGHIVVIYDESLCEFGGIDG